MKTLGERRVRVSFNPTSSSVVDQIKQKTAEMIDLLDSLPIFIATESLESLEGMEKLEAIMKNEESKRLVEIAQKEVEQAGMWAVKAATV